MKIPNTIKIQETGNKKMKTPIQFKIRAFLICLTVWIITICPVSVFADNIAEIKDIKLANTRDDLLVYFKVTEAFPDNITQAVMKGIPTTFSFYITLHETDRFWFNKKLADRLIKSTISYNSLKKEFTVLKPWKNDTPRITQSFEEAKALMTEIDNLTFIPLDEIVKGKKYQLSIKAELDKVTLPLYLHNIFFFVSYWNFETNWYLINFTY
jgi:hypothetical protein